MDNITLVFPTSNHNYCIDLNSNSAVLKIKFKKFMYDENRKLSADSLFLQGISNDWTRFEYWGGSEEYILNLTDRVAQELGLPTNLM